MKKFTLAILAVVFIAGSVLSQDIKSKNGWPILPKKGDCALGIDASPVLEYFGNLMNGNTYNSSPSFAFTAANPLAIYGKYFTSDNTAFRAMVRVGFTSDTYKNYVIEDLSTPDPDKTVEDKLKETEMNIVLGAGIEKRRGKGRVQGLYGIQGKLMFGNSKDTYEYGNEFSGTFTSPTSTDWSSYPPTSGQVSSRLTETKSGSTIGIGVDAIVGVEYFFAPMISVGGEFSWGIGINSTGDGETSIEYWDGSSTTTTTATTAGESHFGIDTGNFGGAVNLLFYF